MRSRELPIQYYFLHNATTAKSSPAYRCDTAIVFQCTALNNKLPDRTRESLESPSPILAPRPCHARAEVRLLRLSGKQFCSIYREKYNRNRVDTANAITITKRRQDYCKSAKYALDTRTIYRGYRDNTTVQSLYSSQVRSNIIISLNDDVLSRYNCSDTTTTKTTTPTTAIPCALLLKTTLSDYIRFAVSRRRHDRRRRRRRQSAGSSVLLGSPLRAHVCVRACDRRRRRFRLDVCAPLVTAALVVTHEHRTSTFGRARYSSPPPSSSSSLS
ncbi:hypothetical protein AGLY_001781 [Aphis glycines]|uniref:Uncharacterized protein n=1 Tax=Aphis glycines TaxID=307491 RepID=A0A6G0U733_APHGL|nr:hypothetical protein AGLY_001781 [Aphis glycines]